MDFLAQVPRLKVLHLKNWLKYSQILAWPDNLPLESLLGPVPDLTELHLNVGNPHPLPPALFEPVPLLATLTLDAIRYVPKNFMDAVPALESLALDFRGFWHTFRNSNPLADEFLSEETTIREISIRSAYLNRLPTGSLSDTLNIEALSLYLDNWDELPRGLLSDAQSLEVVDFHLPRLSKPSKQRLYDSLHNLDSRWV